MRRMKTCKPLELTLQIYLIYGYVKGEREDLTPDQVRTLAKLMKDMKESDHG